MLGKMEKDLHFVFVDPAKAYDRMQREGLWYCNVLNIARD